MKKFLTLLVACMLLCPALAAAQDTAFHWELYLPHWETAQSLEATEAITRYDGSTTTADHMDAPAEGCVYLLAELSIAKTAPGGEAFQWENLFAVDAQGNRYARMENDTFIQTYGFKRLPASKISIGDMQGFIAFEVPAETAQDQFTLEYELADGVVVPIGPAAEDSAGETP